MYQFLWLANTEICVVNNIFSGIFHDVFKVTLFSTDIDFGNCLLALRFIQLQYCNEVMFFLDIIILIIL